MLVGGLKDYICVFYRIKIRSLLKKLSIVKQFILIEIL
jgi:hypothetical protein